MKNVLIIGCHFPAASYRNLTGEIGEYEGENPDGTHYWVGFSHGHEWMPKADCHMIQPLSEIVKAKEDGKDVEYWNREEKIFKDKESPYWDPGAIYRIKPPKPTYIRLPQEELACLVGRILIPAEQPESRLLVTEYNSLRFRVYLGNRGWKTSTELLEEYKYPDGSPVGSIESKSK